MTRRTQLLALGALLSLTGETLMSQVPMVEQWLQRIRKGDGKKIEGLTYPGAPLIDAVDKEWPKLSMTSRAMAAEALLQADSAAARPLVEKKFKADDPDFQANLAALVRRNPKVAGSALALALVKMRSDSVVQGELLLGAADAGATAPQLSAVRSSVRGEEAKQAWEAAMVRAGDTAQTQLFIKRLAKVNAENVSELVRLFVAAHRKDLAHSLRPWLDNRKEVGVEEQHPPSPPYRICDLAIRAMQGVGITVPGIGPGTMPFPEAAITAAKDIAKSK